MKALQRYALVHLGTRGWQAVLAKPWDDEARACLAHWAAHDLPLVVTRQPLELPAGRVALGIAAPGRWRRRRLALDAALEEVSRRDAFPTACALTTLPEAAQAAWQALCRGLAAVGADARVHGSHGWQVITGLDHLRPGSDLDLCITVADAAMADASARLLGAFEQAVSAPRLDGELLLAGDTSVAWREWAAWRGGQVAAVLVKRLHGATLERSAWWLPPATV